MIEIAAKAMCDAEYARRSSILEGALRYPESQFLHPASVAIEAVTPLIEQRAVLAVLTDLRGKAETGPYIIYGTISEKPLNDAMVAWLDSEIAALKETTT